MTEIDNKEIKSWRDFYPPEKLAEMDARRADFEKYLIEAEEKYWQEVDYETAVQKEIAKVYSIYQELAIQRQQKEKPLEYQTYYDYCEWCKTYVKERKGMK